ncbi:PTS system mannose/fructose/N-acetylgalactosamine-transporter subunit IIB [Dellaglioa carnosa]|uniref:PTS system mannose/fructose/N-acetylgalactosamine-transporter subunit IIB n=1 Tax=Dellaglioa carnosa TaxID=2995136 RepID=UPI0022A85CB2|nr:PTS sugar transporter subunit IIB [Dellaglioa carnosa]MCZ2492343.1 PTS sugar transporter subunit IIB [Dellaglioa carnosa]
MPVLLARVDERLIHGVVVTEWFSALNPKRFMIVDDTISNDETLKRTMRMAKPGGTGMSVINTETAITNFKNGKYDDHGVFLLVKNPETLVNLKEGGVEIPKVDIGIIFPDADKKRVSKYVALGEKDEENIKKLQELGLNVVLQYLPNDPEESINKYM